MTTLPNAADPTNHRTDRQNAVPAAWILDRVRVHTAAPDETDPTETPTSAFLVGKATIIADAKKPAHESTFETIEMGDRERAVNDKIMAMRDAGDLFYFNGYLAPPDDAHLRAVVTAEANATATRKRVIGRANTILYGDD